MALWYYERDGAPAGPVEADALRHLAEEGVVGRDTLVWKDGMPDWTRAGTVTGLLPAAPPPAQTDWTDDEPAWDRTEAQPPTLLDAYRDALQRFSDFEGRASRAQYWLFTLANVLIAVPLVLMDLSMGTFSEEIGLGLLSGVYSLAVFLPGLAISVRRLHDTGRSGWWLLLSFVPLVGLVAMLYFYLLPSDPESNAYGPPDSRA